jgi:hypothetical protein
MPKQCTHLTQAGSRCQRNATQRNLCTQHYRMQTGGLGPYPRPINVPNDPPDTPREPVSPRERARIINWMRAIGFSPIVPNPSKDRYSHVGGPKDAQGTGPQMW